MEKRLLLSWIAGERSDIVCGNTQTPTLIEANFADAALAFLDEAAMAAGVTLERVIRQVLSQFRRAFSG